MGWSNFVNSGFPFHKDGSGLIGRIYFFLFFTIFCGIAKFLHLGFFIFFLTLSYLE